MYNTIKDALLTATAFLSNNRVPPNTGLQDYERLKNKNHMESKKFYMVMTSVAILAVYYVLSVSLLFFLPNDSGIVSGYITMFSKTIEVLAIIIGSYVGAQAVVDLKYGSTSTASIQGQLIKENIEETITAITTNSKEEDYELK
jgi:hypothetical protein